MYPTHNLCFEQIQEKYQNFSSKNYHFYSREILQYIARTCLRNVPVTYPRVANFSIGQPSKRWNDQTAVVYDSFERVSGCRYFAIIDQDEFFIPGKCRTLQEMFVSSLT